MAELEFFGAAGTVTGSMHILHQHSGAMLLDCGLFQGRRQEAQERNSGCPVDPKGLKSILLSHAHIDHTGRVPRMYRDGFTGPTICTRATSSLLNVMLLDSAKIQEEDARFWNEKRAKGPEEMIQPLYTSDDALLTMEHIIGVPYKQKLPVGGDCYATFLEAGHVLGSASLLVEVNGGSRPVRLLYTGDLGRFDIPILKDPTYPLPEADYLITESTYADGHHANGGDMKAELARIVNLTVADGGKVIIPAFSLGRTQHVVYALTQAIEEKLIDPLPIYVDSPLSVNITQIFREHPECYDESARSFWRSAGGVFGHDLVTYITSVNDSKSLNDRKEPCIIISASGMCEFGRILHHIKNNIEDERNTICIVGYQAENTLGRRIVERREHIRIFGRDYELLARVEVLTGFSAHADANDFLKLLGPVAPSLKGAFVVHGEGGQLDSMRKLLNDAGCANVHIPAPGERFKLE